MRIGLIDVDSHNFPNLPLMKISTWHKQQGDSVEWYEPLLSSRMDKVYMSKVFTDSKDYEWNINANEVIKGGTGYFYPNGGEVLKYEIEHQYPDYDLYNIKDTAYGFLTRGCPRSCSFCIVSKKEGIKSKKVADIEEFWKGQKEIKLLDPNLLASKEHLELLGQLIKTKSYVDFTQGLDARLLTKENIELLKQIKIKTIHFAWDFMSETDKIIPKLEEFKKETNLGYQKLKVYVLTNYDTTMEENLYRIYKLKELGYDPFVMVYDKPNACKEIRRLQRWVNNKIIFRSVDKFEDYKG
ncbi:MULTISPECIES: radical SAM protein [unclassified Clostridioides]|uniref:radical SAM protein n=1 Tax=unclassified Clostridioides TaxID=2635829 RepID=UPI001D0FB346|nr:radical SAM protein [Clostridioides sp. ES-S-0171-01]MCC0689963.1 radical SAM protein [Clostridioides sp. ES-S-0056-01]MCC0716969.1 radical SAM protein [Clostridioides sp. ES-S-0077-01]